MEFGSSFANSLATSLATSLVGPEVSGPYVVTFSCQHGSVGATVDGIGIQSGDEVEAGKTVIFTITPDEHYEYDGPNPESVVVNSNITKAYVCRLQYFAVNFSCTNGTVRAVSEGFEIASGDRVDYGKSVVFTITPDEHYHYVGTNPETVVVTGIVTKDYVCSIDTFSVTATATNGSVSGTGIYNYGSTATLTFIPNEHYHFVQWSDGDTNNPRDIVVTGNVSLTVDGVIDQHTVNVSATNGTAYGQGTYNYGTSVEVGVTPSSGYRFVEWSDGDTNNPRTVVVDSDKSFSTTCQPIPVVWNGLKFTTDGRVGSMKWVRTEGVSITKTIQYSLNQGSTWVSLDSNDEGLAQSIEFTEIWLKGDNLSYFDTEYYNTAGRFVIYEDEMTGEPYATVSGNIMSLIDSTNFESLTAFTEEHAVQGMFYGCRGIISASGLSLPARTLTPYCYQGMFQGCRNLTSAPSLPATNLVEGCYSELFYECSSLVTAPSLPATNLGLGCYSVMFSECTSLTSAPSLPATNLADECYNGMFHGCTSLVTAPSLPATTLTIGCYASMFRNCSSLKGPVNISASTPIVDDYTACEAMFFGSGTESGAGGIITVGGNVSLWNEENCSIDSTYWTVKTYSPLASASYSYNSYGTNQYYYNFDGEYCRVSRSAGAGTAAYELHFRTSGGDWYYLTGTGISPSPVTVSSPSATIWTGVLYELV